MIRLLTTQDTDSYRQLRLQSRQTDPQSFLSPLQYEHSLPRDHYYWTIKNSYQPPFFGIYGYFSKQTLIAHVQLSPETLPKQRHLANLYDLYVLPQSRRQKVGTRLVQHCLTQARASRQIKQVHLRVISSNSKALDFYSQLGFKLIAIRPQAVIEADQSYSDELLFCFYL